MERVYTKKELNQIKEKFLNIPISINNYYGDATLQWDNTISKLKQLQKEKHKGIVSIITRGYIDKKKAKELKEFTKGLNFILIVSVSEMPKDIEPLEQKYRYISIENALKNDIKVLPNIRPLIPGLNATKDKIEYIYQKLSSLGIETVVVSGFRGDDHLVSKMNLDEKIKWNLRVKIITKDIANIINENSKKYDIFTSKRVSCGVAKIFDTYSHNPYYYSPLLVDCQSCSQKEKCSKMIGKKPEELDLKFLQTIGYDIEYYDTNICEMCHTTPDNRLDCPSCCTACYFGNKPKIFIKNQITLADTAFVRFFTKGVIGTQTGISDKGGDTGRAKVLSKFVGREVHLVNSWFVWSRQLNKCYGCKYCITEAYNIEKIEYGSSPLQLFKEIEKKLYKYEN